MQTQNKLHAKMYIADMQNETMQNKMKFPTIFPKL